MKDFIFLIIVVALCAGGYKAYKANQDETSEARTVNSLPPTVQHTVAQMDTMSQSAFFNEYEKKKRKLAIAYVAWFFIGFHYLYTKKVGVQFAFWATWFIGIGEIWWVVDLFRMPSIVRSCNEGIARDALQTLSIGHQFRNSPSVTPIVQAPPADPPVDPAGAS